MKYIGLATLLLDITCPLPEDPCICIPESEVQILHESRQASVEDLRD